MIRGRVWAASSPKPSRPSGPRSNTRAQREELVNPVWAFTCEDSYGLGIGQAVAGRQGVGGVLAGAVAGPERHGDAALRPGAGAVGEGFLGDENRRDCPRKRDARPSTGRRCPVPTITGRGEDHVREI